MNRCYSLLIATVVVVCMSVSSNAALVISGDSAQYTGPGAQTYVMDITATAVGPQELGGFNMEIDFSDANLTLQSVVYSSVFDSIAGVPPGSNTASLQATDFSFPAETQLADGQSVSLATVTFQATGPAFAGFTIEGGANGFFDGSFGSVGTSLSPSSGGFEITPVPSPTGLVGLMSLGMVGLVAGRRRRLS